MIWSSSTRKPSAAILTLTRKPAFGMRMVLRGSHEAARHLAVWVCVTRLKFGSRRSRPVVSTFPFVGQLLAANLRSAMSSSRPKEIGRC